MVLRRDTEGTLKSVKDAKVAVYAQVWASDGSAQSHRTPGRFEGGLPSNKTVGLGYTFAVVVLMQS